MNYPAQDIFDMLKSAREIKGLSQRDLSRYVGVPQGHISKIENGGTDIRVSSLIELARALDLDLRLIPRKALPAVDGVVRDIAPPAAASPTIRDINRLLRKLGDLRLAYPGLNELRQLAGVLETIKNQPAAFRVSEILRAAAKPVRALRKAREGIAASAEGETIGQRWALERAIEARRERRRALERAIEARRERRRALEGPDGTRAGRNRTPGDAERARAEQRRALGDAERARAEQRRALEDAAGGWAERRRALEDAVMTSAEQLRALEGVIAAARELRRQLVGEASRRSSSPRPAYRLDDDEGNADG